MNSLLDKYGEKYISYRKNKKLNTCLKVNKKVIIKQNIYFKLKTDNKNKSLKLDVLDNNDQLIEDGPFILYKTLKERLEIKLNTMALVFASKKEINNYKYFRYYKIIIYELISFEKFLYLLENNVIKIYLSGRASFIGEDVFKQRNKGITFSIDKDNVEKLFRKIYKIDYDNKMNYEYFQVI